MNDSLDPSSLELAERLGVLAATCVVRSSRPLSTNLYEVVLDGPGSELGGPAGSDVMLLLGGSSHARLRRRYSVRSATADSLTLWIATGHAGVGAQWARTVTPGTRIDVVGPRGKIHLDPVADWHLFIGDASALGAFYRLADAIEAPGQAMFIVEVSDPTDSVTASFDEGIGVTGIFVDRRDRSFRDPEGLLAGLAALSLPEGEGHAYVFSEFHVTRSVRTALMDLGLAAEQISHKAYWRDGQANKDHGEPDKTEG